MVSLSEQWANSKQGASGHVEIWGHFLQLLIFSNQFILVKFMGVKTWWIPVMLKDTLDWTKPVHHRILYIHTHSYLHSDLWAVLHPRSTYWHVFGRYEESREPSGNSSWIWGEHVKKKLEHSKEVWKLDTVRWQCYPLLNLVAPSGDYTYLETLTYEKKNQFSRRKMDYMYSVCVCVWDRPS